MQMRIMWEDLKRERLEKAAARSTNSPLRRYTTSKGEGPVVVVRQGTTGREVDPPSAISWDRGRAHTDMKFDATNTREPSSPNTSDAWVLHFTSAQLPDIGNVLPHALRATF